MKALREWSFQVSSRVLWKCGWLLRCLPIPWSHPEVLFVLVFEIFPLMKFEKKFMKYLIEHMTAFRCQLNENEWNCHSLVPLNFSEQLIDFIKPVSSLWFTSHWKGQPGDRGDIPWKKASILLPPTNTVFGWLTIHRLPTLLYC